MYRSLSQRTLKSCYTPIDCRWVTPITRIPFILTDSIILSICGEPSPIGDSTSLGSCSAIKAWIVDSGHKPPCLYRNESYIIFTYLAFTYVPSEGTTIKVTKGFVLGRVISCKKHRFPLRNPYLSVRN